MEHDPGRGWPSSRRIPLEPDARHHVGGLEGELDLEGDLAPGGALMSFQTALEIFSENERKERRRILAAAQGLRKRVQAFQRTYRKDIMREVMEVLLGGGE